MNCPTCGHQIDDPGVHFCPECAGPIERSPYAAPGASLEAESPPEDPGSQPNSVPFEDGSRPFLERYWQTLVLSFSDPKRLYSNMRDEDLTAPVIYAVITGTISGIFGAIWQVIFGGFATMFEDSGVEAFAASGLFAGLMILLMPIMVVIGLFLGSAIFHLCLMLFGAANRGFGITLRAIAYGYGPNLLAIIPFCGGLIGGVWTIVLTILGAFYGHRTDAWRAIAAYFVPMLVCCGIMMVIWFLVMGMALSQGM